MGIPTQDNCRVDDPAEHVLWALVNIGGMIGAPLVMPKKVMEQWSKHLYRCGFRHHPELQEIFYEPPGEDATIWDGVAGRWVEAESVGVRPAELSVDKVEQLLAALDDRTRAELKRRLDES